MSSSISIAGFMPTPRLRPRRRSGGPHAELPSLCGSSAHRSWSPPTRPASWCWSATRGTTSTPISAPSRRRWAWPCGDRLAIGTKIQVWEFVDVPAVTAKLDPPGRHDACFLPRSSHVTGNIQIHEMAWGAGGELWVVNTRFSCLCTLDGSASFVPRWRPPFVSALEPTDRCHLNGLGMVDGRPRYVTALGETDAPAGWRANKAKGGMVMDVASGEVITRGLSMPHSPRWYGGRLWVCESGAGTFGFIDLNSGKYEPIAEVPGFTRGLDFAGNLAFVGLSQVRESAVFSGIPITERLTEEQRTCGVCAIDLRPGRWSRSCGSRPPCRRSSP